MTAANIPFGKPILAEDAFDAVRRVLVLEPDRQRHAQAHDHFVGALSPRGRRVDRGRGAHGGAGALQFGKGVEQHRRRDPDERREGTI